MSPRRNRRPNRDARRAALNVAVGYRCPDCHSEQQLAEEAPGVLVLTVQHDPTCPAYVAMTNGSRQ